jgi:hypothetical protein
MVVVLVIAFYADRQETVSMKSKRLTA